ncbi:transporter, partial [Frateuria sp. Soil773]|uniref:autotransporter serine protease n=1 Tax=Frateuria sp. Soil773 TaxID=1736407 RepID=UPI0006F99F87
MESGMQGLRRREMAALLALTLGLSACGGGGGGGNGIVRSNPPSPPPSAPPPAPPPESPPPYDAQLNLTHARAAQQEGYSGQGVTIGIVDSGIARDNPSVGDRVVKELVFVDPSQNNTAVDDVVGHGSFVAEIAAGMGLGMFQGGIAPSASLVSARIISDKEPTDDGSGLGNKVTADDAAFFAQTLNPAMIDAGVQIQNNSWGGIYWDTADAKINNAFADAYRPYVEQHNGLVVFAAGNEHRADPSDIASLPNFAGDLARGWLVAVAIDSNKPGQLADYSNACGRAMNYCLAAPGNVIVGALDKNHIWNYYIAEGTSFAAPQVSGAAALVWQAFPYFSNDLVRQTLLGAADDLGAPGVDPVYGYGMLNVGRAVHGPSRFDWGDADVTLDIDSTWSNPISGEGGLIKRGSGKLTLSGDLSYAGDTQVIGGTLSASAIPGNLDLGNVDSTVVDVHSVGGDLDNAGTFQVAGGDVTVKGDYYQRSGVQGLPSGRLAVELGSVLRVAGKATLDGKDLYVIGKQSGYVAHAHTDVLVAAGGLSGAFSAVNAAPNVMLTATPGYDANSAWLDVARADVTAIQNMSYTAASAGAAQRVEGAFRQLDTQLAQAGNGSPAAGASFVAGAASLQQADTLSTAQRSLESLSGQLHAASAAMAFEAIDASTRALSDRFDRLLDAPQAGGWTQDLGYHGGMARSGYSPVGVDLSGMLVGNDYRLAGNAIAGYAISQSQGLGRLAESADQGRSHALEGMLYGGVIHGRGYLMGRFGVGDYRETMRRRLQLGSQFAGVGSDSRGRYGVAYGETGYRLAMGGLNLTPYVNLQYSRLQNDGFNELGANGFGLKAGGQAIDRWQAGVGMRAVRRWALAHGGSLSLQARVLWQRAFAMRGDVAEASFTGIDQWAPLGGIGLSRYGGMAGATVNWQFSPDAGVQLGYDQRFGQREQARMATLNY